MTVIRPNSISGVTSITALTQSIEFYKSDGSLSGANIDGISINTSGIITAAHFYGNGSNLTGITAGLSNIVEDTSPQLGGNLDTNSHEISLDTSHAINFGDSNELQIKYHSGNGQIDFNGNTSLQLKTPANKYFQVVNRDNGNNIIQCQAGGEAGLYHNGNKTAYTHGSGFNLKGGNTSDQTELQIFGNQGQDASILLTSDDGDDNADNWRMYAQASDHSFALKSYASGGYQSVLKGTSSRSIELHYQGSNKLQTVTGGVSVFDQLSVGTAAVQSASVASFVGGQYNQVNIADGSNSGWGLLLAQQQGTTNTSLYTYSTNSSTNKPCSVVNVNNDCIHFATNNTPRFRIQHDGHVLPSVNNNYNLGSTGNRWANIYTNDLNLSNKGSTNCVDNTWGDYTIQEGESDLFLINNRSGKKYKFNLTEVN